jgi:hypothetical protein
VLASDARAAWLIGTGMEVNQLRRQLKDLSERINALRGFL